MFGVAACGDDDSSGPDTGNQLVVGALLSLTGPGQTLGRTSDAALALAADDVNAALADQGSPVRVSLRVEDTGLDPAQALDRLRTLAGEGVRVFIGPQSSSEVGALKAFADSAGVVLLSQGSTAGALSIPDDNIFRLVPDDGAVTGVDLDGGGRRLQVEDTPRGFAKSAGAKQREFAAARAKPAGQSLSVPDMPCHCSVRQVAEGALVGAHLDALLLGQGESAVQRSSLRQRFLGPTVTGAPVLAPAST